MGGDDFPLVLKTHSTLGRHFVASRNIEPGEVVLEEDPLIVSPNAPSDTDSRTCVGCCGITQISILCGKCLFPVCKVECGDIPDHADFECKIFTKEQIKFPLPSPYCFIAEAEYIKVLRCLLLREFGKEDPKLQDRWNKILELEAHVDLRKTVPKISFMSKLIRNFIQDTCKLTQFDENIIDFVLGALDVNGFKNNINPMLLTGIAASSSQKNATVLYEKGCIVAHGCRRNTQSLTYPNGHLEMRAGTFIAAEEVICHAYCDLMLGTPERRKLLRDQFYFDCACERCADPTELGTYFSALKCLECPNGYLLMDKPLDAHPFWKCDKCPDIQSTEYETELLSELRKEENKIIRSGRKNNAMFGSWIGLLEKFCGKFHENHYALLQIQIHLIRCMAKIQKPSAELVEDMQRLITKYRKIYSIFYPQKEE